MLAFRPDRKPNVDERIGIYLENEKRFYGGELLFVSQDVDIVVNYDEGDIETLNLDNDVWKFENDRIGSEPRSHSDRVTVNYERLAEQRSERQSESSDAEKQNVYNGQASSSREEQTKRERRNTRKNPRKQKTQNARKRHQREGHDNLRK